MCSQVLVVPKLWLFVFTEIMHNVFIPQSLRAVGVLFSSMVSGMGGRVGSRWAGGGKKFVRAVSQKP